MARLSFLILLLGSGYLPAQEKNYVFTRLTTESGLSSNRVYCIMQDPKGFIWFGTVNGLQRYDGNKIIYPDHTGKGISSFPNGPVLQMMTDAKKRFWLRFKNAAGIFNPVTNEFKAVDLHFKKNAVRDFELFNDSRGNVFVLEKGVSILVYDSSRNAFIENGGRIKLPPGWNPFSMLEDKTSGNYWISCDSGLALYDYKKGEIYYRDHNPEQIRLFNEKNATKAVRYFFIDRASRYWMVCWPSENPAPHLLCYDSRRNVFLPAPAIRQEEDKTYFEYSRIAEYSRGSLWIFGIRKLMEYQEETNTFKNFEYLSFREYGKGFYEVYDFFEDRENNIWVATDKGVYIFNPSNEPVTSIEFPGSEFEKNNEITSFSELSADEKWIGSWGKGIISVDKNFTETGRPLQEAMAHRDINYKMVWNIHHQLSTDWVWVGCQLGRLMIYERKTGKKNYLTPAIFENRTLRAISEDKRGNIWLATQGGHLIKCTPGNTPEENKYQLVSRFNAIIYRLYCDRKGYIWVSVHQQGVYCFDTETQRLVDRFQKNNNPDYSLYSNMTSDIVQFNDSLVFIGSEALSVLNTRSKKITHFTQYHGLPTNTINTLVLDREGILWVSTLNGIASFNYQKQQFVRYGVKDRIIKNEGGINVSRVMKDGRIFFGGTDYMFLLQPGNLINRTAPPDVHITGFKVINNYLPLDSVMNLDKIRLSHKKNSITIEYSALNFLERHKLIYYYRLEGAETEWSKSEGPLIANYTFLPPGEYKFQVWCQNSEGVRSNQTTGLSIRVMAPFWRTGWFLSLVVVFVLAILYFIHYLRSSRLLAVEKMRSRIARDLHDDMGSTLSTINILSAMAKSKISHDPVKTSEYIGKISEKSQQMMEAMDDIVWSINPMNDSMKKITARMREFATSVLEAKDIDLKFEVEEKAEQLSLGMEARRDVFLIFKEAINNIVKYSRSSGVDTYVFLEDDRLIMRIRDNGTGFDPDEIEPGNGLANMKKRAESLKGFFSIESKKGEGTAITLSIPVN